jgi:hypothetical protein
METKIPTAEEIILSKYGISDLREVAIYGTTASEMMIDFAKLHVQKALEEASETCEHMEELTAIGPRSYWLTSPDNILNSYSLDNIK